MAPTRRSLPGERARARSRTAPRTRRARVRQTQTADDCQRGGAGSSRESSPGRPREVGLRCKRSASRPRAGLELLEKWARCAALCAVKGSARRQRRPQEQQQPPAWPPPPRRQPPRLQPPKRGQGNRRADFSRGLSECLWIYMPSHQDDVHEQQAASLCHASHPP